MALYHTNKLINKGKYSLVNYYIKLLYSALHNILFIIKILYEKTYKIKENIHT